LAPRIRFSHDVFGLQEVGGVSRYVVELHRAFWRLGMDSRILAGAHINRYLEQCPGVLGFRTRATRVPRRIRRCNELFNRIAAGGGVFHRTFHGSCFRPRCRIRATTVYDMIPELFAEATQPVTRESLVKRRDCESADIICAISETTRKDLHRLWGLPLDRISVTPLGVTKVEPAPTDWVSRLGPFLLHVGRRGGYKNFLSLLSSAARILPGSGVRILCFGGGAPEPEESQSIDRLGLHETVCFVSGSDADLAACYQQALGHVTASLYEGFGLTPLEAMSHGCPVACSNRGSLPEVVGDAAHIFDPDDPDRQDEALRWLMEGRAAHCEMIDRGHLRCARFTWDDTARATLDAYNSALEGR
jgi:glycosyltransferase involved in cell wall biosynthesis